MAAFSNKIPQFLEELERAEVFYSDEHDIPLEFQYEMNQPKERLIYVKKYLRMDIVPPSKFEEEEGEFSGYY